LLWLLIPIVGTLLMNSVEAAAPSKPLIFAGSGANILITERLVEAFTKVQPNIRIEIPKSLGSTGGIRAVADGAITVGLVSRELTEAEKRLGLAVWTYARMPLILGAHVDVPDDSVTFEELVQIYQGTKTRWKDGNEIIVLTRQPGDGSIVTLEKSVPGFREAYAESQRLRRWTTLVRGDDMNRLIQKVPHSFGLFDPADILEGVRFKPLRVNGVAATPENVQAGRYALVRTLECAYRKDTLPAGAGAFFAFIRSKDGEKVLRAYGYAPGE